MNNVRSLFGLGRWSFSRIIKKRVKSACTFVSRFEEALTAQAHRRGLDGVVCGHIHEPRIDEQFIDGVAVLYANCGDWIERASALVEHHDGRLEIIEVDQLLKSIGWTPNVEEEIEILEQVEEGIHAI